MNMSDQAGESASALKREVRKPSGLSDPTSMAVVLAWLIANDAVIAREMSASEAIDYFGSRTQVRTP